MFQKRETHFVPGPRPTELWPRAWEWWGRQGFQLAQTGPTSMHGTSFYSRIGLRREVWIVLSEAAGGTSVDVSVNAQLTDEGLVAGAVSAVLLWPVAVVGGAVSYSEYEADARNLMLAFWQYLDAMGRPAGVGATGAPRAAQPPLPSPCAGCGAAMLPDWKVCPYCGRARAGSA